MTARFMAQSQASLLGLARCETVEDEECIVAEARAGFLISVTIEGWGPAALPKLRARSWAEMSELLERSKIIREGGL